MLLAIAPCGASGYIFAQNVADTVFAAGEVAIGEVTIYGVRSRTVGRETPPEQTAAREVIPVQTLSGGELQRLSVHSVADAVRYFSGVQIKDYGGIGGLKTVNIRSMGSQHTGVFYDGIELGNAQNGIIDMGRFSLENMESVSLYNGQKSAVLQPAKDFASAGSVYMAARTPEFAGGKKFNIKAGIKGGSFGTFNPAVLWERRLSERVAASFGAEYMYTTGRYRFSYRKKNGYDTTEVRRNGDVRALRMEQGLSGKIEGGEWKTRAYFYGSERGYPGAAVREEPGMFRHQDRQSDASFFMQSSLKKRFGNRYSMLLSAKYAYDYLHYRSDPRLDVTAMYVDNRYRQQEAYFSSAGSIMLFDWWSAGLSADLQYNTLSADLAGFVYPQRYTGLTAATTALHLRRFRLQASVLGTFVSETTRTPDAAAGNRHKYTPAVAAWWRPWKETDLNFRAFYKKIFRMPTMNDLYYTFIGNKDLNPEYTTQYNAGATYAREFGSRWARRMEVQVDAYYNRVTGKIIAMPVSNQFRWTMLNLGLVEIRGVDAALANAWQPGTEWALNTRISYTFQRAQDFTAAANSYHGDQIPYIPLHSGSLVAGGSFRRWGFNYSFIYTGERWNASANIAENREQPWYTHDVSLSHTLTARKKEIRLTAEVNNLLNRQYEVVQCYPMPGTNFYFKITVNI